MSHPSEDPTLVVPEAPGVPGLFFVAVAVTVCVLTIGWSQLAESFIRWKQPIALTTSEYNEIDFVRELRKRPAVAIAGSSLSKQLRPEYFASGQVGNFSAGGGSVLTGLEAMLLMDAPPRIVLAEINILDRPIDKDLSKQARFALGPLPVAILAGLTRPLRQLLTEPYGEHRPPDQVGNYWREIRPRLRSLPPKDYDTDATIEDGLRNWSGRMRNNEATLIRTTKAVHAAAQALEQRGSRVYFLYMPYDPRYDRHPYAERSRELLAGNIQFNCKVCVDVRQLVDVAELRWEDGLHLDRRSSAIVADALDRWVAQASHLHGLLPSN